MKVVGREQGRQGKQEEFTPPDDHANYLPASPPPLLTGTQLGFTYWQVSGCQPLVKIQRGSTDAKYAMAI